MSIGKCCTFRISRLYRESRSISSFGTIALLFFFCIMGAVLRRLAFQGLKPCVRVKSEASSRFCNSGELVGKGLFYFLSVAICFSGSALAQSASKPNEVTVDWNKTVIVSRSTPTLQVVVNPMLRSGSPIHDASFQAAKDLGADYVRYVPWLPYPRLGVAELEPPTKEKTSWDYSLIDPMTKDFLAATEGHSTVMNFSTIPA